MANEASVVVLLVCSIFITNNSADEFQAITTRQEPDSDQACMSISIPHSGGNHETHYLCFPKERLTYKENKYFEIYGINRTDLCPELHQSQLAFDAPWLTCPQLSEPDPCLRYTCPEVPYNRQCQSFQEEGQCCPSYYCGNGSIEDYKNSCRSVSCEFPEDIPENCTIFHDTYDCCPKMHCDGPTFTQCPYIYQSYGFSRGGSVPRYFSFRGTVTVEGRRKRRQSGMPTRHWEGGYSNPEQSYLRLYTYDGNMTIYNTFRRCIGDHTCPDGETCCPAQFAFDGRSYQHRYAYYGFCVAAVSSRNDDDTIANNNTNDEEFTA